MSTELPIVDEPATIIPPVKVPALPGILDVPAEELRAWLAERRQPPMRVNQIRKQILANRATTFEDMSDLPKGLRAELATTFAVFTSRVERHLFASSDDTHKLVLRLHDDRMIECVLIQDQGRATTCVSTQVGCGMGCVCRTPINRDATFVSQEVNLPPFYNRGVSDRRTPLQSLTPRFVSHISSATMREPLRSTHGVRHASHVRSFRVVCRLARCVRAADRQARRADVPGEDCRRSGR